MVRQPLHVDADRGIADIGIANGRAGFCVLLPQPHAKLIGSARGSAGHLGGISQIGFVLRLQCGRVIARLAADANVILGLRAHRLSGERQHDPHSRVLGVDRVEVAAEIGVFLQVGTDSTRACEKRCIRLAVGRPCEHVSGGVQQFHHGVERTACLVDVDPDFAAGVAREAIDVDIRRRIQRDVAMHLKAQPTVVVAALLVWSQHAERLCR